MSARRKPRHHQAPSRITLVQDAPVIVNAVSLGSPDVREPQIQRQLRCDLPDIVEIRVPFRTAEPKAGIAAHVIGPLPHRGHRPGEKLGLGVPTRTVSGKWSFACVRLATGRLMRVKGVGADVDFADDVVVPLILAIVVDAELKGMFQVNFG